MVVGIFKALQLVVVVVFGVFISDHRRRPGSDPLLLPRLYLALKVVYLIPFVIYIAALLRMRSVYLGDYIAFALTLLGTTLVIKARHDIGSSYTWTGYCLREPKLVTTGAYAYVRHPIYSGIFLFIAGGCITSVPRISLPVLMVLLVSLLYILVLLYSAATRETEYLTRTLGDTFRRYSDEVGAIMPFKRLFSAKTSARAESDS